MKKDLPSPEILRKLLRYNEQTGELFWLSRLPDMFLEKLRPAEHSCAIWNAAFANKKAFTADDGNGYFRGAIFNKTYRAHRIAWAIYYGEWPSSHIDHINGDKKDNRIENLRDVDNSTNMKNAKKRHDNTSGATGVHWNKECLKWQAELVSSGKKIYLGLFNTLSEAVIARNSAQQSLGFTERHGK